MELLSRDEIVTKEIAIGGTEAKSAEEDEDEEIIRRWEHRQRERAAQYRARVAEYANRKR